jgi:hypothetical protein
LGLSFDDLVKRYGVAIAEKRYQREGRSSFLPLTVMKRFLSKVKPDLVISTNSPRTEKAVLLTARKMAIPSICLVDLFDPREIEDRLGNPGYADKICVFSDGVKKNLINSGRPLNEIVVTGNPDFDRLSSPLLKEKAHKYRLENCSQEYMVLWVRHVGKPNFKLNCTIDDELIKIAKRNSNILFIFRPHPNEPKEYGCLPANVQVSTSDDDIQVLLLSSDLVLTIASTVGLQAVACQIPLITFDMGPTAKYTPYSKMGLSCGITKIEELEKNICYILKASANNAVTMKYAGNATQNIIDVAKRLLSD